MFCEKCGTKLPDNAEFCTNCGEKVGGIINKTQKVADTEIQLKVKPYYSFGYMVLPTLIGLLICALFMSFIMGMVSSTVGLITFLISLVVIAIILGIKVGINKKQYENYTYDFYKTKVIYKDSFLNMSEKEVKYKYIREVTMRQTFIQRFFNLGTIILFTNAETGYGNGICIVNIQNVQETYKKIKEIIDV